jgi:hypothetical protein
MRHFWNFIFLGSTNFQKSSSDMIQTALSLCELQEEYVDDKFFSNTSKINGEANGRNKRNISSQIGEEPLVLVPLSVLRSSLTGNEVCLSSYEADGKSKLQANPNQKSSRKNNMSSKVMKNSENLKDQFYLKLRIDNLTTPSNESSIHNPQRGRNNCAKRLHQKLRSSKMDTDTKIRKSNTKTYQARKSKSSTSTRAFVQVIRPLTGVKEERKGTKKPQDGSQFCKVCGDEASRHAHYGGRSCNSCRAFFRRSIEASTKYAKTIGP